MKSLFKICLLLFIQISLFSCIKEDDFNLDNLSTSDWMPDVALPLVSSSLNYSDIFNKKDSISLFIDDLGQVVYFSNGSIFSKNGASFLNIPSQTDNGNLLLNSANIQTLNQTGSYSDFIIHVFPFGLNMSQRIDNFKLKKGTLKLNVYNTFSRPGSLSILIPKAIKNGVSFNETIPFSKATNGDASYSFIIRDLKDYNFDLTQSGNPNSIEIDYAITYNNIGADNMVENTGINFSAVFDSLEYSYVSGYFGILPFPISVDSAKIDLFSNNPNDSFSLTSPSLKIELNNSIGMPISLTNIFIQPVYGNGQPISLTINPPIPNPKIIPGANSPGQIANDSIVLNSLNSNIVDVFSQKPKTVSFSANAVTNDGNLNNINFITDTSAISANLRIELPFRGWAKRFTVEDTSDFKLDNLDKIDSAVFRIDAINGFPLNAYMQIYFTDSNFVVKDSMLLRPQDLIIESAEINSIGVAISPSHSSHDEVYVNSRLQRIKECTKLIVRSQLSTNDAPQRNVSIMNTNKLDIKIGIRARLKIKTG